jgi:hypothetical protein
MDDDDDDLGSFHDSDGLSAMLSIAGSSNNNGDDEGR